jgi:DNA-binding IclR family transcriptional regulator
MAKKELKDIKHGQRVVDVLTHGPLFHKEIEQLSSLDTKTTQTVINNLKKHGFINKDTTGRWKLEEQ